MKSSLKTVTNYLAILLTAFSWVTAKGQENCVICQAIEAYNVAIAGAQVAIANINIGIGAAGQILSEEMEKPEELRNQQTISEASDYISQQNAVVASLIGQIQETMEQIQELQHDHEEDQDEDCSVCSYPTSQCICNQQCSSCFNPLTQCTCSQQCSSCFSPLSQCACNQQCQTCYNTLSLCTCSQ